MAGTNFDVIIAGTKARVIREEGGYSKRFVRREIEQNLLTQSDDPVLTSRADKPGLYQTSWAGGSRWWKPLITRGDMDSYFQSNHMDTWSEPGKIVPGNAVGDGSNTSVHDNCVVGVGVSGEVFAIGSTNTTDATNLDVYKWTPASNAFIRQTGYTSGVDDGGAAPHAMVYDPADGYFYVISDDDHLERFSPAGSAEDAGWITTGFTTYPGANIFLQSQNLMFYDGDQVYTVDKAVPDVTVAFNDGLGPDFLNEADFAGTNPLFRANVKLALATPEGLYYVKNTRQGALPEPWVFRVDRDAAGNWLGFPIATLPLGSVALSMQYHLGSIVIPTTPDWQAAMVNDANEAEIVLYHVTQGGSGSLGAILGGRDEMDETPYALLGAMGQYLYIGGQKRLWVYDAVRGGLHSAWEWGTELADGAYVSMAWTQDSAGDGVLIFLGKDRLARTELGKTDNPDTVTNFGDDLTHYSLTSNYFDGGLPMELKQINNVEIQRDKGDGSAEWRVQISADDGAFTDVLTDSGTSVHAEGSPSSAITGYRFQYRVIYQTKDTDRNALRSLLVSMTTGESIAEWDLILDGTEMLNVDNKVQDEAVFRAALETIAATETETTLVDNYQNQNQNVDDGATTAVKVMAVEVSKEKPGESRIRVVLREV